MYLLHYSRRIALAALIALASTPGVAGPIEPAPLEAYGELPAFEDMALSPSGERIALLGTINGSRSIVVVDKELKPVVTYPLNGVKVRSFDFVTEDRLLLRRSTTEDLGYGFSQDKFEFYQAISIPLDGGSAKLVFGNQRKLVNAVFGYYGTRLFKGRPAAFFGAIELAQNGISRTALIFDHGRPALYAVDLLDNSVQKIDGSANEGFDREWLVSAEGTVTAKLDTNLSSGKWKISGSGGVIASGTNPAGDIGLISIGQDGSTIIFSARDEETGESHWYEVKVDGSSEPSEVFADEDIERIYRDPLSGHLVGYLRNSGEIEPVFFNPKTAAKVKSVRRAFSEFNNRMVDWTRDFGRVIVRTDGNGDSGSYFHVDLAQSSANAIVYERPDIGPERVGSVSTFGYAASDGLGMDGILTLPPGNEAKNLPLVMLPHGGPHSHDEEGFDWWAQAFASRGYAVFQPNFRGSTNRDEEFRRAGYGEWGGKMQSDISDGLAALAGKGIIDPKRACIVGASYGGYAALAGVTLQQGLYRCAVSVAGVADLSLMSRIENWESGNSKVSRLSLEEELGPRSRLKERSPRHQAERTDAPILLIHGRDDTVVYFEQSLKMADALKDAGKPYEFLELEGEDHWLSLGETRKAMLKASVAFVIKYNPPD